MNQPPICPECGARRLKKLSGREDKKNDERWICPAATEERAGGGLGPFKHEGRTYDPMWMIRSNENQKKMDEEHASLAGRLAKLDEGTEYEKLQTAELRALFMNKWSTANPGDCVVDRALRTVYLVHTDGSRRRCQNPELTITVISGVKQVIERQRAAREAALKAEREAISIAEAKIDDEEKVVFKGVEVRLIG